MQILTYRNGEVDLIAYSQSFSNDNKSDIVNRKNNHYLYLLLSIMRETLSTTFQVIKKKILDSFDFFFFFLFHLNYYLLI
jgi:hypothetical protein